MSVIQSKISPHSEAFLENRKTSLEAMGVVEDAAQLAMAGGGDRSRDRHVSRGKVLPRERVDRLLDPGSAFLEIGQTAAHDMYSGVAPSAGLIAGVGAVLVFLPQILILFLFLAILEDCGYMARAALLMHRHLRRFGDRKSVV